MRGIYQCAESEDEKQIKMLSPCRLISGEQDQSEKNSKNVLGRDWNCGWNH